MDRNPSVFISCEDDMPRRLGVFNIACTVTSVLILWVPLRTLRRVMWTATTITKPTTTTTTTYTTSAPTRTIATPQTKLYAISLLLLFLGNLVEHASGYVGPPSLDACATLHNLALFAMMYQEFLCNDEYHWHISANRLLPSLSSVSFIAVILGIQLLLLGFTRSSQDEALFVKFMEPVNLLNVGMTWKERG